MIERVVKKPSGDGEPRWAWAMLLLCFVLAGPVLVSRFNIAPSSVGLYVLNRFHLEAALLLAIPIAVAFDRIGTLLTPRLSARVTSAPAFGHGMAVLAFLALIGMALPRLSRIHSPAVDEEARNLLASLPPNAVVIGADDDVYYGTMYVQLVDHVRPDVLYIQW